VKTLQSTWVKNQSFEEGAEEVQNHKGDYLSAYLLLALIGSMVIVLDQWTKYLVRTNLSLGQAWMPLDWLAPYARIVHLRNSGAAFSMFQGGGMIFAGFAIIVAVFVLYYLPLVPREKWYLRVAMGLQFGGVVGNLLDRLMHDFSVTDMVSVGRFPVFNIADASVLIGTAVLILGIGTWLSDQQVGMPTEVLQERRGEADILHWIRAR